MTSSTCQRSRRKLVEEGRKLVEEGRQLVQEGRELVEEVETTCKVSKGLDFPYK